MHPYFEDDNIDDLMAPETKAQRHMRISNHMRRLSAQALAALIDNPDHPQHDYALGEEDYRASIASDPRIAQAMGEPTGEYNGPS